VKVLEHTLQIAEDIVVPVSDDDDFLLRKKTRATVICSLSLHGMLPTIEFNGERKAWTVEIQREWTDRMLSSELQTIELTTT